MYNTEACGAYGVCCPMIDDKEKTQLMKTWVIFQKVWKEEERREMAYQRANKQGGWKDYNGKNSYEE